MNHRNIFDSEQTDGGFLGRIMGRFTSGSIINIVIFLFVAGILLMTFLYVGQVFFEKSVTNCKEK